MYRKIAAGLAVASMVIGLVSGCKKEESAQKAEIQPTEAPKTASTPAQTPPTTEGASGEGLFKMHCSGCHPNGGNVVKPEHTLKRDHLKAHNITKAEDIVKIMRNPGPGMNKFDAATVPDKDATAIAEYVLKTY
ncbi:c-type cytochrome [Geomonas sp. RF6]|uniref:c-type cytochrome n=1 Tax=Geomonas sp. RF6 TaxID=2897342 RepID=UPI001E5FA1EA|nr:c-type cytochrome [Geomonas sp. RF6]UFS69306.1 c-type cytochrome [Geomonas sp. RF6]